jgi:hypothetical protein
MNFSGRSRWCRRDYVDPSSYNVGYEFVNVSQINAQVFQRLFEKYGSQNNTGIRNNDDYMWR